MKTCFATIVSPNYLAYARVLGDSLAQHAAHGDFRVLVVNRADAPVREAVATAGLEVTYATELGIPDFEHLAYKYDLVELNTALKPTFLKSLFDQGYDQVVYLDPDICLYQPLAPVDEALAQAEIVLIPHALAPAMDGLRPSDIDFLRTGAYNLGFIALRRGPQALALLDWWERRCLAQGFNDPGFGTFVDQKWMDLAPSYFDSVHILKHPGCNVAYWNLHERSIAGAAGGYSVNGAPLVFFHFSGVDSQAPQVLSRHQNRHTLVAGTPLAGLVADYCARLLAAGHGRWSAISYSFGTLDDGSMVTGLMRRAAAVRSIETSQPFRAQSGLQAALRGAGIRPGRKVGGKPVTTLNFDPDDRRVRTVNFLIRLAARIIGAERVGDLIRYATFLGWGSNYAAVLLDRPPELRHIDERKAKTP
ncbi:MAG TPA: hypothetical protein VK981_09070 [Ramlibacter sp.]|nr:hypothetical protein [Ramlibacter sp.]